VSSSYSNLTVTYASYLQKMVSTEGAKGNMDSTVNDKIKYELRRDEHVAELATAFRPVQLASLDL
jgi:hypothetical protein